MKQYEFSSPFKNGKAVITIDGGTLTISRPGLLSKLTMGFKGEKTILIKNITSVQIKPVKLARGYIQFTIAGEVAKKAGMTNGQSDENIVYYELPKCNKYAEEIKQYIENFNSQNDNSNVQKDDKYDQLAKLKKLLDDNIISQEEFNSEKDKLLNN